MGGRNLYVLNSQLGFDIQLEEDWDVPIRATRQEIRKTRRLKRLGRLEGYYLKSGQESTKEFYNARTRDGKKG